LINFIILTNRVLFNRLNPVIPYTFLLKAKQPSINLIFERENKQLLNRLKLLNLNLRPLHIIISSIVNILLIQINIEIIISQNTNQLLPTLARQGRILNINKPNLLGILNNLGLLLRSLLNFQLIALLVEEAIADLLQVLVEEGGEVGV
jgi:hypothetical protein